jgi:hypothetical protein
MSGLPREDLGERAKSTNYQTPREKSIAARVRRGVPEAPKTCI